MPDRASPTQTKLSLVELQSVDSTNNYARRLIIEGSATHAQAVFAREQLAGKGQRGKSWLAEKGSNILLSLLLNPYPLRISQQFQLTAMAAVSAHEFFSKYAGDQTKIKWPNDLYWQDRKAGGILIESVIGGLQDSTHPAPADKWRWAILGLGININQSVFDPALPNPVSLKQITGKNFEVSILVKELAEILCKNFDLLIKNGFEEFLWKYNTNLYKKDQPARFRKQNRVFEGIVKKVSADGKLIVDHGMEEALEFGDLEWLIN